jgi:hypothetical protein
MTMTHEALIGEQGFVCCAWFAPCSHSRLLFVQLDLDNHSLHSLAGNIHVVWLAALFCLQLFCGSLCDWCHAVCSTVLGVHFACLVRIVHGDACFVGSA